MYIHIYIVSISNNIDFFSASIFIEFRSTHQNSFYFVKDNPHKLRDDLEELKRLGGLFNTSVHDVENGIKVSYSLCIQIVI